MLEHFVIEYEFFRNLTIDEREFPRSETPRHQRTGEFEDPRDINKRWPYIERARNRKSEVADRLHNGFHHFAHVFDNTFIPETRTHGLLSDRIDIAKRFVHAARKAGNLKVGNAKDNVFTTHAKILSLDCRYITLNKIVRAGFRIDFDTTFDSHDHLVACIRDIGLPCMPHAICGTRSASGKIINPHAWFLLPHDAHVWYDQDDPRCNKRIMRFYDAIHHKLVTALRPIGADPGCLSNPMHGKNPLCPLWDVQFPNSATFLTMSQWHAHFSTTGNNQKSVDRHKRTASGTRSNNFFDTVRFAAFDVLREWHFNNHLPYLNAIGLPDTLEQLLGERIHAGIGRSWTHREARRAEKLIRYAAKKWDPQKLAPNRPCRNETAGLSPDEARAAGGRYTARKRAKTTLKLVIETILELRRQNTLRLNAGDKPTPVTHAEIARRCERHVNTVSRHWHNAIAAIDAGSKQQPHTDSAGNQAKHQAPASPGKQHRRNTHSSASLPAASSPAATHSTADPNRSNTPASTPPTKRSPIVKRLDQAPSAAKDHPTVTDTALTNPARVRSPEHQNRKRKNNQMHHHHANPETTPPSPTQIATAPTPQKPATNDHDLRHAEELLLSSNLASGLSTLAGGSDTPAGRRLIEQAGRLLDASFRAAGYPDPDPQTNAMTDDELLEALS